MRTSNLTLCTTESHRSVRHYARTDRNRLVAIAEIIALVAIVISLIAGTIATSAGGESRMDTTTRVFVEQGDTVWTIATQHPVDGQTTEQTATQIAELNDAMSGGISAGTTVDVPTAAQTGARVAYR